MAVFIVNTCVPVMIQGILRQGFLAVITLYFKRVWHIKQMFTSHMLSLWYFRRGILTG